jgi:putative ABC transport system permease protein
MKFTEILRMALGSLGVNKLRSSLTMLGITIGVFSVIGVMTAVSALRQSIETGISFLGSNIIQIAKRPIGVSEEGSGRRRFDLRRDITLAQALRFKEPKPRISTARPRPTSPLAAATSTSSRPTSMPLSSAGISPRRTWT